MAELKIDYHSLGSKIKQERHKLGLTQEKVAEEIDLSESFYGRIEAGSRVLSVETLVKIANFYDLSIDYLLLDSTESSTDDKLLAELNNIFRDKSPSETALLLNLLKIQADNITRLL